MKFLISFFIALCGITVNAATWHVGSSQTYTIPSQVSSLVHDGDTVYIDGGVYSNDAVKWTRKQLRIIGLGSGNNRTILQYSGNIPNGKGIFVFEIPTQCDDAYIENVVFDGAQVSDVDGGNGAGIRFQANNLTIVNCKFINCQNGILEGNGSVSTSNVIIQNSEFENNGYQLPNDPTYSGYEHHIYIGASTDSLFVTNCFFHHPRGQANSLKTRAQRSFILYNMIDEDSGYGSWEIDIAQGGLNIIIGNIIIQGSSGANHGIVGYDSNTNPLEDFYFINNTVINKFTGQIKYFNMVPSTGINAFKIYNNIFASIPGSTYSMITGNVPITLDSSNNLVLSDYSQAGFTNLSQNDFTLMSTSPTINQGINPGSSNTGYFLLPINMYQSFQLSLLPRMISGASIDIGAYEYSGINSILDSESNSGLYIYPNPSNGKIRFHNFTSNDVFYVIVYSSLGKKMFEKPVFNIHDELDLSMLPNGLYVIRLFNERESYNCKLYLQVW